MDKIPRPERLIDAGPQTYWHDVRSTADARHGSGKVVKLEFVGKGPHSGLISAAADSPFVCLWNVDGTERQRFDHGDPETKTFAIGGNNREDLFVSGTEHLHHYRIADGELVSRRQTQGSFVESPHVLAVSPAEPFHIAMGSLADFASWGGEVRTTAAGEWEPKGVFHWDHPFVNSVAFSPDGRWLAAGKEHGLLLIWDMQDPRAAGRKYVHNLPGRVRRMTHRTFESPADVCCVLFAPTNDLLAVACGSVIFLRGVDDRRVFAQLTGHCDWVNSLCFSPDGQWLVSGSDDGTARIWDIPALRCERTVDWQLGPLTAVACGENGTLAAGNAEGTIVLWDHPSDRNRDRRPASP